MAVFLGTMQEREEKYGLEAETTKNEKIYAQETAGCIVQMFWLWL
jgi:hypothetical protein